MFDIFVLAFIQGISEFLPISSSFHLIVFRDIFFVGSNIINSNIALTFDISLHLGTALAILVYFYKDFKEIITNKENKSILLNIIIATIPAAIVGFLFDDIIENIIRTKYVLLSLILILVGIIIYFIDKCMDSNKTIKTMSLKDSIIIGLSQTLALVPGFSRSGTTIATSRLVNINRVDAAKFSFYLSEPIVLGSVIYQLYKVDLSILVDNYLILLSGMTISFIIGLLSINLLLKYLQNNNFKIFMWYRIIFGIFILLYLFLF